MQLEQTKAIFVTLWVLALSVPIVMLRWWYDRRQTVTLVAR